MTIRVKGRNGIFDLHESNVFGSDHMTWIDLLAKRSRPKNAPAFLAGPRAELLQLSEKVRRAT